VFVSLVQVAAGHACATDGVPTSVQAQYHHNPPWMLHRSAKHLLAQRHKQQRSALVTRSNTARTPQRSAGRQARCASTTSSRAGPAQLAGRAPSCPARSAPQRSTSSLDLPSGAATTAGVPPSSGCPSPSPSQRYLAAAAAASALSLHCHCCGGLLLLLCAHVDRTWVLLVVCHPLWMCLVGMVVNEEGQRSSPAAVSF
jgi:hypothetical protein